MAESDTIEAGFLTDALSSLQIRTLRGRETIGQLFDFVIEVVATREDAPKAADIIGSDVSLCLTRAGEPARYLHGMIAEVVQMLETEVGTRTYRLRMVPRAYRLRLVELQEIYMDMAVPDIIRQKLELVQLEGPDAEFLLTDSYPVREFVVQYRESDLAFICRLAEHLGISIFWRHDEERDCIVVTDGSAFRPLEATPTLPYRPRGESRGVYELSEHTSLIPSQYVVHDYNYRTPQIDLKGSYVSPVGYAGGVIEYGPHFKTTTEGDALARVRAEERESTRQVYHGRSDTAELSAGATFRLEGHGARDELELLLVEVEHELVQQVTMHGGSEPAGYHNRFRAVETSVRYRPPRITAKPRIHGLLTGVVEQEPQADPKKYARIDEDGRYTVKFIYDTAGPGERKASRPVRMLQPHAGAGYGMHYPLKPGIEVALAFVDGDPDRPVIVGAVPNPETPSPVTAHNSLANTIKTASGIVFELKDR